MPKRIVHVERDSEWVVKEIVGDISKFSRYVLVPDHPSGKDKIFRDSMGYAIEDAEDPLRIYISQAHEKLARKEYAIGLMDPKEYAIGLTDPYGQRFTVEVELAGKGQMLGRTYRLLSGWILDANGTLKLTTPFTGFAS